MNRLVDRFMPIILPEITDRLKAVPLPRIAGHSIHPRDFWITGSGKNNLALAGNLVRLADSAAAPAPRTMLAFSGSTQQMLRIGAEAKAGEDTTAEPELQISNGNVLVRVSGQNPTSEPLEYRFRVDGGPWSVWKQRSQIPLQNLLGGTHRVDVCARTVMMKQEQGCPFVEFTTEAL
jgi:hypothetical protein